MGFTHTFAYNQLTQCLLLLNKSRPSPASRPPRFNPSPSPRLSRLTSTRNSVPTRAGANPRSSRLAPEGSGYPSFWNVLIIETILVGGAEAYRTGMVDPVFDELSVGDVSPGGRFDPLSLAESGDLEELKIKELKHCRLAMFAWLG